VRWAEVVEEVCGVERLVCKKSKAFRGTCWWPEPVMALITAARGYLSSNNEQLLLLPLLSPPFSSFSPPSLLLYPPPLSTVLLFLSLFFSAQPERSTHKLLQQLSTLPKQPLKQNHLERRVWLQNFSRTNLFFFLVPMKVCVSHLSMPYTSSLFCWTGGVDVDPGSHPYVTNLSTALSAPVAHQFLSPSSTGCSPEPIGPAIVAGCNANLGRYN